MTDPQQPAVVRPPSMQRGQIVDPKLAAALRTLELTVKRKLDGVLHGDHLGLIPGPGSEPGESREYQPGDDVRRMDWAVTARTAHPQMPIEIECRDAEEVAYAIGAGADRVLLDNMDVEGLRAAVELRDREAGGGGQAPEAPDAKPSPPGGSTMTPQLEASGGVTLENVRAVAETGVEFISVGALTHSAPALDFSLLLEPI